MEKLLLFQITPEEPVLKIAQRLHLRTVSVPICDYMKSIGQLAGFSDEERAKMTELLSAGFIDTFRYFYPDKTGEYSWWSYRFNARKNNAGWRIDYFIVSEALKDRLVSASIHQEIFGSDHCPVELELKE